MGKRATTIAAVALGALAPATAAPATTAAAILHPGQSKKVGKVVVVCTTHAVRQTAARLVAHPGHQVRVGKATVKCVAPKPKPKPKPAPVTPAPTTTPEPAPAPPPPPVTEITPGSYKGATQDGNYVFFTVTADRGIVDWRANDLTEQCNDGYYIPGAISMSHETAMLVGADGRFSYRADGTATVGGVPDTYHFEITGSISGTTVTGTVVLGDTLDWEGHHLSCSSPLTNWTATLQP
jgi:hypothetical protein